MAVTFDRVIRQTLFHASFDGRLPSLRSHTSPAQASVAPLGRRDGKQHHRRIQPAPFTVDPLPAPMVTSVTPNVGTAGSTAVIDGADLAPGATVAFGSTPATVVLADPPYGLTVAVPSGVSGAQSVTVTNPGGATSGSSSAATFTVNTAPAVTSGPTNTTVTLSSGFGVNFNYSPTFTATATGSPTPTVQWQLSTNGGATWSNDTTDGLPTSDGLLVYPTKASNGYWYRAVFTNSLGQAISNPAALTVDYAPIITQQPQGILDSPGQTAESITASAISWPATTSVQWQTSPDFGFDQWTNDTTDPVSTSTDGQGTTSVITPPSGLPFGTTFRAIFTNSAGSTETSYAGETNEIVYTPPPTPAPPPAPPAAPPPPPPPTTPQPLPTAPPPIVYGVVGRQWLAYWDYLTPDQAISLAEKIDTLLTLKSLTGTAISTAINSLGIPYGDAIGTAIDNAVDVQEEGQAFWGLEAFADDLETFAGISDAVIFSIDGYIGYPLVYTVYGEKLDQNNNWEWSSVNEYYVDSLEETNTKYPIGTEDLPYEIPPVATEYVW